ncbi:MAG: Gfo/Idh/MocA family protein [Candidatus Sumerlaeia bacterium]
MAQPKAVVIGYGFAGKSFHSYLIGLDSGLELHGVCSRNPETRERIRAERGCKAYAEFDEVLNDPEVDLVVLGTPHNVHCEQAVKALNAGKHVVSDKVMCTSLAECDQMIAAAEKNDRLLAIFHNRRWDGDYLTVRKLMNEGKLGDLRWLEMAWQGFGQPNPDRWRSKREMGGGRFFDLGAHMIDQCLMLIPEKVTSVYCRMHHDYQKVNVESHVMATLTFSNGATAVIDASGLCAIPKPRFRLCGTGGAFVKYGLDPQERAMIEGNIDAAEEPKENYGTYSDGQEETIIPTLPGRWRSFYEHIADILTKNAEPLVKLSENRRVMAVFDAARESAQTGKTIKTDI